MLSKIVKWKYLPRMTSSCPISELCLSWWIWQFISLHHSWKELIVKSNNSLKYNVFITTKIKHILCDNFALFPTLNMPTTLWYSNLASKQTATLLMKNCSVKTTSAKKVQSSQFLPTQNITIYQFVDDGLDFLPTHSKHY